MWGKCPTGLMHRSKNLLDHLVSPREQGGRYVEPERPGGLHVDHQLVARRYLHREVGRLLVPEDAVNVLSCFLVLLDDVRGVAAQAANGCEQAIGVHRWQPKRRGESDEFVTMDLRPGRCRDDQTSIWAACKPLKGALDVKPITHATRNHLYPQWNCASLDGRNLSTARDLLRVEHHRYAPPIRIQFFQ